MKIMVTAFDAFDNRKINASSEVLKRLNDIDKCYLEVGFNRVRDKIKTIINNNYDYLILLGEAKSHNNITIEKRAINNANGIDNNGIKKDNEKIIPDGAYSLETTFDIDLSNLNLNYSDYDGAYLCNYVYYLSLYYNKVTKIVFIHLPFIKEEGGNMDVNVEVRTINDIIDLIKGAK